MKKFIYSVLNNLIPGLLFPTASIICTHNYIVGIILYIIAYTSLDLHSYIDKKLNYPYNIFIKH
jgi:hypothetical protein